MKRTNVELIKILCIFREQVKNSTRNNDIQTVTSEERQAFRRRVTIINIRITFISWIVELLAGWLNIIIRFMIDHNNKTVKGWLFFADACFNFILVPSTYVLNNDVTKEVIILENWYEGLRNVLQLRGKSELNVHTWYQGQRNVPPPQPQEPNHPSRIYHQSIAAALLPSRRHPAESIAVEDIEHGEGTN